MQEPKLQDKKWYKYLEWQGKVTKIECIDHSYSWNGKIPCTGTYRCVYCGKPEDETSFNGKLPTREC